MNQFSPQGKDHKWGVLVVIILGSFMAILDANIINVALPKMMANFGATVDQIEWVITAYMIAFAISMPATNWLREVFGLKKGETVYSINLIPLGGFVNITGENGEGKDDKRSFASKTIWQRFQILVAGVAANVLLAIILFSLVAFIGFPNIYSDDESAKGIDGLKIVITEVLPDSSAEKAGIVPGDEILFLKTEDGNNLKEIKTIEEVKDFISDKPDKIIVFKIKRGDKILDLKAKALLNKDKTKAITGIALGAMSKPVSYGIVGSIQEGIMETWSFAVFIFITLFNILKELFTTGKTAEALSGPVGIAVMVGQATQLGFAYILRFMAILSVNLAIINALPFPALDGGRILFLLIEKIKGSRVSAETEGKFHLAGMAVLLLLMALVTYKDFGTYHVWQKITSFL